LSYTSSFSKDTDSDIGQLIIRKEYSRKKGLFKETLKSSFAYSQYFSFFSDGKALKSDRILSNF
jgi:hypothetical protein